MERGRASAGGAAPSPQAWAVTRTPTAPPHLGPPSRPVGPPRSLSLRLLHGEAGGGALTHTEAGGPVGPSPAPHLPRQGNRSSGSWSEKQQGRGGPGGPDVGPPAPPDSLPRSQWQRSWVHLGPRGPRPRWGSEADWFGREAIHGSGRVLGLPAAGGGPRLVPGSQDPISSCLGQAGPACADGEAQEGLAAVLTVPKTPTEDCPHVLKSLEKEACPRLPHLNQSPVTTSWFPSLELTSEIMSRETRGAPRPRPGAPQLPRGHSHPAPMCPSRYTPAGRGDPGGQSGRKDR